VQGAQGSGLRVEGSGLRVQGSGFGIQGSGSMEGAAREPHHHLVKDLGLRL